MEEHGGPDALKYIKFSIPLCTSALLLPSHGLTDSDGSVVAVGCFYRRILHAEQGGAALGEWVGRSFRVGGVFVVVWVCCVYLFVCVGIACCNVNDSVEELSFHPFQWCGYYVQDSKKTTVHLSTASCVPDTVPICVSGSYS